MTQDEIIKLQHHILFGLRMMENTTGFLTHIDKKTNGFFIEAGAHKGLEQSPTFFLETILGWSGLLIEPNPINFSHLQRNRKNSITENCALVSPECNKKFMEMFQDSETDQEMHIAGFMNTLEVIPDYISEKEYIEQYNRNKNKKKIQVETSTLNSLLEKHNIENIDLCIFDVEGYELDLLKGFDLNKYKPKILFIEALGDKYINIIKNHMESNNYKFIDKIYDNLVFKIN